MDYNKTFALVVKWATILSVIAMLLKGIGGSNTLM